MNLYILGSLIQIALPSERVKEGTGERAVKESIGKGRRRRERRKRISFKNKWVQGQVSSSCLTEVKNKEEGNRVEGSG